MAKKNVFAVTRHLIVLIMIIAVLGSIAVVSKTWPKQDSVAPEIAVVEESTPQVTEEREGEYLDGYRISDLLPGYTAEEVMAFIGDYDYDIIETEDGPKLVVDGPAWGGGIEEDEDGELMINGYRLSDLSPGHSVQDTLAWLEYYDGQWEIRYFDGEPRLVVDGSPMHDPEGEEGPISSITGYVVQKGDTLWDIAEAHYGDATLWVEVWESNMTELIGGDARNIDEPGHWIYPGQILIIPSLK